jgi:hypothetical protein
MVKIDEYISLAHDDEKPNRLVKRNERFMREDRFKSRMSNWSSGIKKQTF